MGASLLAMAVVQSNGCWSAGLIASRLAPTKEFRVHTNNMSAEDPMWERACSRRRWFSQMDIGLLASSRASSLPQEKRGPTKSQVGY